MRVNPRGIDFLPAFMHYGPMQNNKRQKVQIITTGGTIDKSYDEFEGSLANKETQIKELLLKKLRLPYTQISVSALMAKDSLDMTDNDRLLVVKGLKSAFEQKTPIVVLHGTDTMEKTARTCFEKLGEVPVAIIFTGAMKPMGFEDSDASQNFTEALLAAKILKPGIYLSFHNRIFEVPYVRKNKEKGTFEAHS